MEAELGQALRIWGARALSGFAAAGFVLIYVDLGGFGADARMFPRVLAIVGCIGALVIFFHSWVSPQEPATSTADQGDRPDRFNILVSYIGPLLYVAGIYIFGFWIASAVCLACLMFLLGERNIFLIATATVGTLLVIYFAFGWGFSIKMPKGLLTEMLGA